MKKAFTLMELIIVVIIISILAGMSILYGAKPTEVVKAKGAEAILQAIYTAEKEYCIHYGSYANLGTLLGGGAQELHLDSPNIPADQRDWVYTIPIVGPPTGPNDCGTFLAGATRLSGPNEREFITIDQTGQINPSGTDDWSP